MIFSAGRLWVSIVPGLGLDFAVHPEIRFQKVLSLILIQLPGCGVCLFQVPGWTSLCIEINTSLILIQPPGCGVCLSSPGLAFVPYPDMSVVDINTAAWLWGLLVPGPGLDFVVH